jgi:hypothetical protein
MILLQELQCFFLSLERGHFAKSWCSSLMKTLRVKQYSFEQLRQYTMLKKVLDPLASNINDFLRRATVFLHSLERGYFAQSWCSPQMKTVTGRQCSFKQQTQFTMLNKVLDPFASNINDSLTLATLHLPFTRTGWVWTKVMFIIHENTEW